jgi:hypothetical protein
MPVDKGSLSSESNTYGTKVMIDGEYCAAESNFIAVIPVLYYLVKL